MLVDSPAWVRHADGITALDVSPNGRRLVTSGSEPQIVIWAMEPILDAGAEASPAVHKKLAVLGEHNGFVLAVKWSHGGSLLASGASDAGVLIYRRSPAPAPAKLGSSFVNRENWRPAGPSLKGHALDVTALSWLPGDGQLASSSMDGRVIVWAITAEGRGSQVTSLQHSGWVKGVAFDPLGRYLASQGRDGVRVWDTQCGWGLVSHMPEPFAKSPEAGFKYRISWSPDGEGLTAANANEQRQPTIVFFSRQDWAATSLVGHRGSVLAAAANPRMFFAPRGILAKRQAEAAAAAASGGSEDGDTPRASGAAAAQQQGQAGEKGAAAAAATLEFDDTASAVVACGSNDRSVSLWNSRVQVPLLLCRQLHTAAVVDLAWTPDGYTLLVADEHNRLTVLRFARSELGRAMTDAEYRALLEREYGAAAAAAAGGRGVATPGSGGRQAGQQQTQQGRAGGALADAADMAALNALCAADEALTAGTAADMVAGGFPSPAAAAAAPRAPAPAAPSRPAGPPAAAAAAAAAGLERRLMPTGAGITTGTLQQQQQQQAGRKRVHPTSIPPAAGGAAAGPATAAAGAGANGLPPSKRLAVVPADGRQQQLARAAAAAGGNGSVWLLDPPVIHQQLQVLVAEAPAEDPSVQDSQAQQAVRSVWLAAANSGASSSAGRAQVSLFLNGVPGELVWADGLQERVVALAGTALFAAAATESGLLYTWRSGGTQLLPPLALGCPPVSMSSPGGWQLQVVGADGSLLLLDLQQKSRLIGSGAAQPNLAPVLACAEPGTTLHSAWVTSSSSSSTAWPPPQSAAAGGSPPGPPAHIAVFSDGSCWMFHAGLALWLMLQPPAAAATAAGAPGAAALPAMSSAPGDMGRVRTAVAAAVAGAAAAGGAGQAAQQQRLLPLPGGPALEAWQRRHAALQCSTAELLGDSGSYRNWLSMLANLLAKQQRLGQLRELSQDLLGPREWVPPQHLHHQACSGAAAGYSALWRPTVCGLDKRQLLAEIVVPAMARNGLPLALQVQRALEAAVAYAQHAAHQGDASEAGGFPGLRLGPPLLPAGDGGGGQQQRPPQLEAGRGNSDADGDGAELPTAPLPAPAAAAAAAAAAAGGGGGGVARRVQPTQLEPRSNGHDSLQQQGPPAAAADSAAGGGHQTNSGNRTPLQEHQQPHNVQQQQQGRPGADKSAQRERTTSAGSIGHAS